MARGNQRYRGNDGSQSRKIAADETRSDSKRRDKEMSEREVVGFLGRKIENAMNGDGSDIADVREENFNLYIGAEYGDEREGYSKFVTREAMEAVEWVMPHIMRVFLSGDRVVEFDADGPQDEQAAKQETDIINHFIMRSNNGNGFLSLHHWIKDALMNPVGYIKCHIEDTEKTEVGNMTGLTEIGIAHLANNPDVEILEQDSRVDFIDQPNPQMPGQMVKVPVEVFDVKVRITKRSKNLCVDPMPGEESLVDDNLTSLNIDEGDFFCHRVKKNYTQLVNEGYDQNELDNIGAAEEYDWNDERTNRLFFADEDPDAQDEIASGMRPFWVHECYVRIDFDGDGLAEFRKICMIGPKIFHNEETNYQPAVGLSAILMQHKHNGLSLIDIVKDIQLLSSIITRQLLDNVYKINVQKKYISEDSLTDDGATMDALLNTQAEYVPIRGPAQNAVYSEAAHSLVPELMPVLEAIKANTSMRTGVSPQTSLDPNILQQSNTGAFNSALQQASQRIEMLIRIIAETGMKWLMLKAHQQVRMHWDIAKTVKIRGEWVDVDPTQWGERSTMTVNTGLGHNSKEALIGLIMQLLPIQKEAMQAGLAGPKEIYNALDKLIMSAGIGDTKNYFIDPKSPDYKPPQPQPDPQMILAQANAQALQQEQQRKAQESQHKAQLDRQNSQFDQMMKKMQAQMDAQDRQAKNARDDRDVDARVRQIMWQILEGKEKLPGEIDNLDADVRLKIAKAGQADASEKQTRKQLMHPESAESEESGASDD